jgi:hypothetical protein
MIRFVMPSNVVWERPKEAGQIARLGALANAVVSVLSMKAGSLAVGIGKQRDTLQGTLMMIGYRDFSCPPAVSVQSRPAENAAT